VVVEGLCGGLQNGRATVFDRGGEAPVLVASQDSEFICGLGHKVADEEVALDHETRDLEVVLAIVQPAADKIGHLVTPSAEGDRTGCTMPATLTRVASRRQTMIFVRPAERHIFSQAM